jgi:hypothetical protein
MEETVSRESAVADQSQAAETVRMPAACAFPVPSRLQENLTSELPSVDCAGMLFPSTHIYVSIWFFVCRSVRCVQDYMITRINVLVNIISRFNTVRLDSIPCRSDARHFMALQSVLLLQNLLGWRYSHPNFVGIGYVGLTPVLDE